MNRTIMNRKFLGMALALFLLVSTSFAQRVYSNSNNNTYNHAEIGAFVNYTRLHNANDTNFFGFGGRLGFNLNPNVQLEAEGAYDFQRNVDTQVRLFNGSFVSTRSGLRMAHFMFGPKFQVGGSSPVRIFFTAKGGLLNFSTDTRFSGQVSNIPEGDTNGVFYPAGGIELYAGWLGMRFEAGDEMYIDHGANHNLRVTVGPTIRF
jgi:hypothetical protein